jgi:hypothetical protein
VLNPEEGSLIVFQARRHFSLCGPEHLLNDCI